MVSEFERVNKCDDTFLLGFTKFLLFQVVLRAEAGCFDMF